MVFLFPWGSKIFITCIFAWQVLWVEDIVDDIDRYILNLVDAPVLVLLLPAWHELLRLLIALGLIDLLLVIWGHCEVIKLLLRCSSLSVMYFTDHLLVTRLWPIVGSLIAKFTWLAQTSRCWRPILSSWNLLYLRLSILSSFRCWPQTRVLINHSEVRFFRVCFHHWASIEEYLDVKESDT